jgi:hypothetical protein
VVYLPVAVPYGYFLHYADSSVSPDGVIRVVGQRSLGAAGALAVVVAVLHWDRRLRFAIVERDRSAISMLSDNGSATDRKGDVVYLAVSTPEIIERYRAQGYAIFRAEPADPDWREVLLTPVP